MRRGQHTKASKIRLEYQTQKKMNNSLLDGNKTMYEDPQKLPPLKMKNRGEDEILKLIKKNQNLSQQKAVLADQSVEIVAKSQNVQREQYRDYDDIRNLSKL